MAGKVDEAANFFFRLFEEDPGIYDKCYPDYARRDKIDLAWERISREMKESCMCAYVYMYIQIQNMSAKAM
jgi:hypothetical protein